MTGTQIKTQRIKRLLLEDQTLLNLFRDWPRTLMAGDALAVPRFDTLPEDTTVLHVNWDNSRCCWSLVIRSESFPEVPQCEEIPVIQPVTVRFVVDRNTRLSPFKGDTP